MRIDFDYGLFGNNDKSMVTGKCPVKRYNRDQRDLIFAGRPSRRGPSRTGCRSRRAPTPTGTSTPDEGWTKVVLTPDGSR